MPFIGTDLQAESIGKIRQQFDKRIPVIITSNNILSTTATRSSPGKCAAEYFLFSIAVSQSHGYLILINPPILINDQGL
ncbi:MAG: hypothetical protein PVI90_02540, partial [Desulfobacteraceae bacterium]